MKAPNVLVCMDADAPLTTDGATFDRECGKCRRKVMLARSGQRTLAENPKMRIICLGCFFRLKKAEVAGAAASPEELAREMATTKPNLRRYRN